MEQDMNAEQLLKRLKHTTNPYERGDLLHQLWMLCPIDDPSDPLWDLFIRECQIYGYSRRRR
jgi:hypothetical protein